MKTQTIINELRDKWYEDCLKYNIPVSPSDVQDIVEELLELKNDKDSQYIKDATFCSIFDDGLTVEMKCKINILTRQVIDIEPIDSDLVDKTVLLQGEYIMIDDEPYDVYEESDERLYDTDYEDFDISKPIFWY